MEQMLIAAFADKDDAAQAVDSLEEAGYAAKDISIITKDERGKERTTTADNDIAGGAAAGATTGGVIGGVAGLLAGAGVVPALAGLLIGGPIAAALGATGIAAATISGAVTGAVAGGLIGALTNLGLSEEDAKVYDEAVTEGGMIVAVPLRAGEEGMSAREILTDHHATQVRTVRGGTSSM